MEWSQLEQFSLLLQFDLLNLLDFFVLFGQLVAQHLLLVVQDLEVFFGAQELVVVLGRLALRLNDFFLLLSDDLLQLHLLVVHQLQVLLGLIQLRLQSCRGSVADMLISLRPQGLFL